MKENQTEKNLKEVVIIGAGPAGLTAAIYSGRAGHKPVVIGGEQPGGQIINSSTLDNFPGFPEGISGPDFGQKMIEQAGRFDVELDFDIVDEVDLSKRPYRIDTTLESYYAKTIIIATGAKPRQLGLPNENKLIGRGVSYCATCDGALYRDKVVAVVGGGDVALEEADFLTRFADKVYLIHRRDEFRGSEILSKRARENPDIDCLCSNEVEELLEDKNGLSGIRVFDKREGKSEILDNVNGIFIAIGYIPNNSLFEGKLKLNDSGYIVTNDKQETNLPGVYAAGDIQDQRYQQVITAAASGAKAAMELDVYLNE
ncbi:MAG: thioredoxin-disulfide reductase [Bacillota bacterium]